jgi:hypothetical protein
VVAVVDLLVLVLLLLVVLVVLFSVEMAQQTFELLGDGNRLDFQPAESPKAARKNTNFVFLAQAKSLKLKGTTDRFESTPSHSIFSYPFIGVMPPRT